MGSKIQIENTSWKKLSVWGRFRRFETSPDDRTHVGQAIVDSEIAWDWRWVMKMWKKWWMNSVKNASSKSCKTLTNKCNWRQRTIILISNYFYLNICIFLWIIFLKYHFSLLLINFKTRFETDKSLRATALWQTFCVFTASLQEAGAVLVFIRNQWGKLFTLWQMRIFCHDTLKIGNTI